MKCRVCDSDTGTAAYAAPAPALTSIMTTVDMPTKVFVCEVCGHAQGNDLPDIAGFYDSVYRISLDSQDHDQVFAVHPDGRPVFRTDHQTELALRLLDLPHGAVLLDYGAAKATTLAKMCKTRPDLRPHVFDVSTDYTTAWQGWVPEAAQATYAVPVRWEGTFDAVMSHFAIEHVAEPIDFLRRIASLLRTGGKLLLSLPDPAANPGDMIVADHLSHFSDASLRYALARSGFRLTALDRTSFPGAFFATAEKDPEVAAGDQRRAAIDAAAQARSICSFWQAATLRLDQQAKRCQGRKAAVYGAGFYGRWIRSRLAGLVDVRAILDRNPHLQKTQAGAMPVLPPEDLLEEIEVLFIGLNPLKAREIVSAQSWLNRPSLHQVFLD